MYFHRIKYEKRIVSSVIIGSRMKYREITTNEEEEEEKEFIRVGEYLTFTILTTNEKKSLFF